jgi:hypothetical protein
MVTHAEPAEALPAQHWPPRFLSRAHSAPLDLSAPAQLLPLLPRCAGGKGQCQEGPMPGCSSASELSYVLTYYVVTVTM